MRASKRSGSDLVLRHAFVGLHRDQVLRHALILAEGGDQVLGYPFVLAEGSDPGPVVEPSELVFAGAAGRSPGSQDVFVYNIAQAAKTYRSTAVITGASLVNLPGDATLDIARPNRVIVQPFVEV